MVDHFHLHSELLLPVCPVQGIKREIVPGARIKQHGKIGRFAGVDLDWLTEIDIAVSDRIPACIDGASCQVLNLYFRKAVDIYCSGAVIDHPESHHLITIGIDVKHRVKIYRDGCIYIVMQSAFCILKQMLIHGKRCGTVSVYRLAAAFLQLPAHSIVRLRDL